MSKAGSHDEVGLHALYAQIQQMEFKIDAATVEYWPDLDVESDMLVFKNKYGRPVLYAPVSIYDEFMKKSER